MMQATAAPSSFMAGWAPEGTVPPSRPAGPSVKLTPQHGDGRSSDPGHGIVTTGIPVKRQAGRSTSLIANGAQGSLPGVFRGAISNVPEFDLDNLVHTTLAVFRQHQHINNVLTHLCGGRWERIAQALSVILNPLATLDDLSPLARNVIELMCAERGVTGRILKPYFHALLARVLLPQTAAYLRSHVFELFLDMQAHDACLSG
jgi:hypothetical protein